MWKKLYEKIKQNDIEIIVESFKKWNQLQWKKTKFENEPDQKLDGLFHSRQQTSQRLDLATSKRAWIIKTLQWEQIRWFVGEIFDYSKGFHRFAVWLWRSVHYVQ